MLNQDSLSSLTGLGLSASLGKKSRVAPGPFLPAALPNSGQAYLCEHGWQEYSLLVCIEPLWHPKPVGAKQGQKGQLRQEGWEMERVGEQCADRPARVLPPFLLADDRRACE